MVCIKVLINNIFAIRAIQKNLLFTLIITSFNLLGLEIPSLRLEDMPRL